MSDVVRVTECRLCDSPGLDLVVKFEPTPPGDHYITADRWQEPQPCYPIDVLRCRACGAVQLADTVDPALIYPEYLYTTSVSNGLSAHFDQYAASVVERLKPWPGALVVDIGSNDGTLLRSFQARGLRAIGVDPAYAIAKQASDAGVKTYCAFFGQSQAESMRSVEGKAQIITANHVMANVADLHDFVEGVRAMLAPKGTFVFETGYWPAIVAGNLIDTIEHEHIHYFAVAPLRHFFARHGLALVSVEAQPTKGGSLRGYVQHAFAAEADETVAAMMAEEQPFTDPAYLSNWAHRLEHMRQELASLVANKHGELWVGYGAAVGSTLQLYHFGLGEHLDYLVDANPTKKDRLSPGFHIPVVSPCEFKFKPPPDKVVILAWRYADMIRQQHPELSGKWLIPLPEVMHA